jgi:hypothetical protein
MKWLWRLMIRLDATLWRPMIRLDATFWRLMIRLDATLWRLLVWLDARINDKWLGGRRETISGRCHYSKCRLCGWLCNALNRVDPGHCERSYYNDRIRNPDLPWI